MKKVGLLLLGLLIISMLSFSFVLAKDEEKEDKIKEKDFFRIVLEKLGEILEKLDIIADKETNVEVVVEPNITVEAPEVTVNPEIIVEGNNGMAKKGNIILREDNFAFACWGGCTVGEIRMNKPLYVALPEGECDITLSTDCGGCYVNLAKDITTIGSGFYCVGDCSGTITISDEYPMIRINPKYGKDYNHIYLAYNCV